MDGLKLLALAPLVFATAACHSAGGRPTRLLDGEPAATFTPVAHSVLVRSRVLPAATLGRSLTTCLFGPDRADVATDAHVVERIGVESESLTVRNRKATGVYACDGGVDPAGERRPPWCGEVFGELVAGNLLDPRLDVICRTRERAPLAYAFVEPVAGAHWIGVDEGGYVELYEALGELPVRVATTKHVDTANARATFELTQYDLHGRKLVETSLEAAVAG